MINLFKVLFNLNTVKKSEGSSIAAHIEIKETSANTWWS
jgi:hypothetical protein